VWIVRINAASRELGVSYSRLIGAMEKQGIDIDRKILADLAISDPNAFKKVAQAAGVAS